MYRRTVAAVCLPLLFSCSGPEPEKNVSDAGEEADTSIPTVEMGGADGATDAGNEPDSGGIRMAAFQRYVDALCSNGERCGGFVWDAFFGDLESCKDGFDDAWLGYDGATVSAAELDACAAAFDQHDCQSPYRFEECDFRGSLDNERRAV